MKTKKIRILVKFYIKLTPCGDLDSTCNPLFIGCTDLGTPPQKNKDFLMLGAQALLGIGMACGGVMSFTKLPIGVLLGTTTPSPWLATCMQLLLAL